MRPAERRHGVHHPGAAGQGHPGHYPVGRPQRRAQAGRCSRPSGSEPQCACHLLPHLGHRCQQLGPRAGRGCGRSHGRGSRGTGRVGAAGPRPEHQAQPPVRPQLRVFLGGPLPFRQDGCGLRPRHPEKRHCRLPQALCSEQSGAAPHGLGFHRGRAHPAGNLPDRLRDGGQRSAAQDHHVRL